MQAWLNKIDPIMKGIWLFGTGLAVMVSMKLDWQLGWFSSLLIIGLTGSGWTASRWRTVITLLIGFALPLFIFQCLVLPGEIIKLEILGLKLTKEAYRDSLTLTLRAMTLFLSSLLFASTTEPRDVVTALSHHMRLPDRFAFSVAIALRFVPLLAEEARNIREAQRLRLLTAPQGIGERLRLANRYAAAVISGAMRRVQNVATAMEAKQFGSKSARTSWRTLHFTGLGICFAALSVAAMTVTILIG